MMLLGGNYFGNYFFEFDTSGTTYTGAPYGIGGIEALLAGSLDLTAVLDANANLTARLEGEGGIG